MKSVLEVAEKHASRPFLIVPERGLTLTFGEFHDAACGLAWRLQQDGLKRGDRLVAVLPNSPEFAVLYFAALYMGATVVPVNPALHPRDVHFVVHNAGAKLVIFSPETKHLLQGANEPADAIRRWELPRLDQPLFKTSWQSHAWRPLDGVGPDDVLTIVFTSGTTAAPKAVAHRVGGLLGNAALFNDEMGLGPADRFLHLMPMAYSGGFFNVLISPYLAGASVVMTPGFGPRTALDFWKLPVEHGVNALWLTPTMLAALLKVDRDAAGKAYCREKVGKIFVGTAPLYPKIKRDFEAAYGRPLYESYGLSETLLISANGPKTGAVEGSVGRVMPGISLEAREGGELYVKTPHLMAGYLDYADGKVKPASGEWFPTGDIGVVEKDGTVKLTGRSKDVIIRGGLNVSPTALEDVLLHHESVAQAAVVGLPNELTGEDIVAVVKLKPGRDWAADKPALEAYCRANFTSANRPSAVLELEEFPTGLTGKIQKVKIREWAAERLKSPSR